MDLETACHDLKEPGIIDENILYNAIIQQGPQEKEGELFNQQGVVYEEIKQLRLEFLAILKIDHLWMMIGLTKLQLNNNSIEKIENLDDLVNLKELDLSFNYIEKIENLDALQGLEVLTLYQNKIEVLENMTHLSKLTIFSIGNNRITNNDSILYLRDFSTLKSFSVRGNPICYEVNFDTFVLAYLPQLVYYEYRIINESERKKARKFFWHELMILERDEADLKQARKTKIEEEKKERLNAEAFVEYLGGSQLFDTMFEKDLDCQTLLKIGNNVMALYNEYKTNFIDVTKELHHFGLEQLELRKAEIARFEKYVGDAKEKVFQQSREIVEDFLEQKSTFSSQIDEILNVETEDDDTENEFTLRIQVINEEFKDLCNRTWAILMKNELYLFEATEEVNGTYERALTELVNQFIEGCQGLFTQLRQFQNNFNEALSDAANKFYTNYTVSVASRKVLVNLPKDLVNMMQDKDFLINALSASHDYHLLVIDQREDKLVSGIRTWLSNFIENLIKGNSNSNKSETEMECPICLSRKTRQKTYMNPYIWFYLDVYEELAPKSIKEIGIEAGRRWRTMTEAEKKPYVKIARRHKGVFFPQMKSQKKNLRKIPLESCQIVKLKKTKQATRMKKKLHKI